MVYSLVYLALRRNVVSTKVWHRTDFFTPKGLTSVTGSRVLYATKSEDRKKEAPCSPTFGDGKSHVNFIFSQVKKGKFPVNDLKALIERVIAEGQYKNFSQAPDTVQKVGFAGLVPMFGIPLLTLLNGQALDGMVFAHLAYGATVLSFLGGSNWIHAIAKNEITYEKLGWCVAPQLIGWTSLILPLPLGMFLTSLGFCLCIIHDVLLTTYPQWMKSLRLVLTGGTLLSFALMFIFYLVL